MRSEFVVSSFPSVTFDFVPPALTYIFLTLLLPECLMEFFEVTTVWVCGQNPMIWPHSNEISFPVLTLDAIRFSKFEKMKLEHLVLVVQRLDSAVQWINLYSVDSAISFPNTYPLDSDSSGWNLLLTKLAVKGLYNSLFFKVGCTLLNCLFICLFFLKLPGD